MIFQISTANRFISFDNPRQFGTAGCNAGLHADFIIYENIKYDIITSRGIASFSQDFCNPCNKRMKRTFLHCYGRREKSSIIFKFQIKVHSIVGRDTALKLKTIYEQLGLASEFFVYSHLACHLQ